VDDIEEIPVETLAGDRPNSTVGDRMLIGLAATALLGGALIAIGNFMGGLADEAAAVPTPAATSSPQPSRTPRPTATPRPLREVVVEPGSPDQQSAPELDPPVWIRAVADLPVFAGASADSQLVRTIAAGEVVFGEPGGAPGWYFVQEPNAGGFVRIVDEEGESLADVVPVQQGYAAGQVSGLFAGPTGFVAHLHAPVPAYSYPRTATIHSANGTQWQPARGTMQVGYGVFSAAWGPAGLLASTTTDWDGGATAWLWESADGSNWIPIGSLQTGGDGALQQLAGSSDGYLLVMHSSRGARVWFSPDGIVWQEGRLPFTPTDADYRFAPPTVQVVPTPAGFVVWKSVEFEAAPAEVALTRNGRSWVVLDSPAEPVTSLRLAVAGASLMGLGRAADGSARAWQGNIGPAGGRLVRAAHMERAFEGAIVSALTSDGLRAYAFGYERHTGNGRGWMADGSGWSRMAIPDFGGVIRHAAAGPQGVVVAGAHGHEFVPAPLLWHLEPGGGWEADQAPIVRPLVPPPAEECPQLPDSTLDFLALEPAVAVACYGNTPLTALAFSVDCPDCFGGGPPGPLGPAWLMAPQDGLLLMPFEAGQDSGWWRVVVLHPDLPWREEYRGSWLSITGHFDDPAASECGQGPPEGMDDWWGGRELEIASCRQTFVVTQATVVEAPG
jgi:hypothetical protein